MAGWVVRPVEFTDSERHSVVKFSFLLFNPEQVARWPERCLRPLADISIQLYTYAMMLSTALPDVRPATRLLKALADDNRLQMVLLLSRGELCVCHIAEALGLSQPNASQHLTVLKNAGVVDAERRGNWIYYRLLEQDPLRAPVLQAVLDGFSAVETAETQQRLTAAKAGLSCG